MDTPAFTIGIEEEYFLVHPETGALATEPQESLLTACVEATDGRATAEFMRSQIEVGTKVCATVQEARADLAFLRRTVGDIARDHGLALIAASTHPFARWDEQKHVDKARYNDLADELQAVVRRLLICGMHVHVGIEDDELRIDLMNQVRYFLPHLLALSTSSPFWRGDDTGLQSYRTAVFKELPRTGLPPQFESFSEYRRHVDAMVGAGLIEDGTKLWWDIRPSDRFPTLEMRACDVCTRLDDAICVAAVYLCLLRMLYALRRNNQRWRTYQRILIEENRWRAQRYGVEAGIGDKPKTGLVDFGKGRCFPYPDLFEEIIDLVRAEAEKMGCLAEVEHGRTIIARGTSAQLQREVYAGAMSEGRDQADALRRAVSALISETRAV